MTATSGPWLNVPMPDTKSAREKAFDLLPQILERFLSALEPFTVNLDGATARHLYSLLVARGVRCAYLDGRFTVFLD